jgi:hypothetical protein
VDDRNVGDGGALGLEDVAPSLGVNGGAVGRSACPGSKAGELAERWLKGGGDARPVHSMAQCKLCTEGGASRAVVGVRAV